MRGRHPRQILCLALPHCLAPIGTCGTGIVFCTFWTIGTDRCFMTGTSMTFMAKATQVVFWGDDRKCLLLSDMFRRSASLSIPHLKSFAAIPSVSLVLLGHTNRSVFLSHESQREIALVEALSRPIPYYQQGEVGEEKWACVSQCLCFGRFAGRWHRTIRIRIRIAAASHDTMPLRSRDIFKTLQPSPQKTTCSFSYRFMGKSGNWPRTRPSGS